MNKLFTFTVISCGTVSLLARTSEVFNVYRRMGAGDNIIYSHVMKGNDIAQLSSENPTVVVLAPGEYSIMSTEGYMCPTNVNNFFKFEEGVGCEGNKCNSAGHLPNNIALSVIEGKPDSNGNPTYSLAIQQAGVTVGTPLPLQPMLDTTGDVIGYQFLIPSLA